MARRESAADVRLRPSFDVAAVIRRGRRQARMAYACRGWEADDALWVCQESVELIERHVGVTIEHARALGLI
jgi:hypothetical protein